MRRDSSARQRARIDGAEDDVGGDVRRFLVDRQDRAVGMRAKARRHFLRRDAHQRKDVLDARLVEGRVEHAALLPPQLSVRDEDAGPHQELEHRAHGDALRKLVGLLDEDAVHQVRLVDEVDPSRRRPDVAEMHRVAAVEEHRDRRVADLQDAAKRRELARMRLRLRRDEIGHERPGFQRARLAASPVRRLTA